MSGQQPPTPVGKQTPPPPHHHRQPPPPERRGNPRAPIDKAVDIRLLDDLQGRTVAARLTSLSASGVSVRLARPLARGREFVLLLPGNDATHLRYRVVRCQPLRDGQFEIGAAFVRAPAVVTRREPDDDDRAGDAASAA